MTDSAPQATAAEPVVRTSVRDGIAILRIDNPPVNAGSRAVRAGLLDGLRQAEAAGLAGAVVIGAGRCFVAGSDLREFDQPLAFPELPDVIRAIEAAPFPVVAALHGVALGGGLELALGCDWRVAAPGIRLGLPEVGLGMVPGAGGTQRLPRLVGRARAIGMICGSERIDAAEALALGLVDRLAEGDLLEAAVAFLAEAPRPKRPALAVPAPAEAPAAIEAAADRALRRGRGRPNVAEAIRLVRGCEEGAPEDRLAEERAAFQRLRVGPDAAALRYLFFAERRAATVPDLAGIRPRQVATVGIVGGGTMGQGIARAVLAAGLAATVAERDAAAAEAAAAAIRRHHAGLVARGRLDPAEAAARDARLATAVGPAALAGCDLAIEAVFEEMSVKRDVFAALEAALPAEAVIATNTSYLDIDAMAASLARPDRVLGLHFFSPADAMPLLEIVRAARTSATTLATGLALARRLGKQPVVARVADGFIGNRIYAAYRRRAELLVLNGTAPEAVDAAIRDFGFAMGPFEVADLSGLDIAWAMRKRQAATRAPSERYVTIPDRLCEAGRLGRKTGRGWYDHSSGAPRPDPEVAAIIAAARAEAGITPVPADAGTIQRQLLAAIVAEAAAVMADGVAARPSDIDVALVNGYGFPRWRGGPLYWARHQSPENLADDLATDDKGARHSLRLSRVREMLSALE